MHHTT